MLGYVHVQPTVISRVVWVKRKSMCVRTRKKTFLLRLVAIVTCKSFVLLGYGAKNESNHLAEDEQLYQVKRMIKRNRQRVVLDLLPNTKCARSSAFFEPLVQMTTPHVALNYLINCPPSGN